MKYGRKANLSTKSCSDISELDMLGMKKIARNTSSCQKVAVQLVESPNHIRGQNGNYKKLVRNERKKEGSKNVLHLMGLLLT